MEEFLKELGIDKEPTKAEDGTLVIEIANSNEYAKYYSLLENSDLVDEDESSSQLTLEASSIQYVGDNYVITLMSNLEADTYQLTIKEN